MNVGPDLCDNSPRNKWDGALFDSLGRLGDPLCHLVRVHGREGVDEELGGNGQSVFSRGAAAKYGGRQCVVMRGSTRDDARCVFRWRAKAPQAMRATVRGLLMTLALLRFSFCLDFSPQVH